MKPNGGPAVWDDTLLSSNFSSSCSSSLRPGGKLPSAVLTAPSSGSSGATSASGPLLGEFRLMSGTESESKREGGKRDSPCTDGLHLSFSRHRGHFLKPESEPLPCHTQLYIHTYKMYHTGHMIHSALIPTESKGTSSVEMKPPESRRSLSHKHTSISPKTGRGAERQAIGQKTNGAALPR